MDVVFESITDLTLFHEALSQESWSATGMHLLHTQNWFQEPLIKETKEKFKEHEYPCTDTIVLINTCHNHEIIADDLNRHRKPRYDYVRYLGGSMYGDQV